MLAMMLTPAGRVIDGKFVARGQWASVTASKTVDGFFVATIFLRGGGKGAGGDATADILERGEYGGAGGSATHTSQAVTNPVITIGAGGADGTSRTGDASAYVYGDDGVNGGTTSCVYNGNTRTAVGGTTAGRGAERDGFYKVGSNYNYFLHQITNPGGGYYGSGGGRFNNPPTYSKQSSQAGVVQFQLED